MSMCEKEMFTRAINYNILQHTPGRVAQVSEVGCDRDQVCLYLQVHLSIHVGFYDLKAHIISLLITQFLTEMEQLKLRSCDCQQGVKHITNI